MPPSRAISRTLSGPLLNTEPQITTLEADELSSRLTVGERIGGGTSGRVYRATFDGIPAALKVLHPHAAQKEATLHEFFKEAHVLFKLQHQ